MYFFQLTQKKIKNDEKVDGRHYKYFRPKEVFIPCVKYKLPSKDRSVDGVDEIIYAESLHFYPGQYSCQLTLECPADTKVFYKVEIQSSISRNTNNTLVVSSQNDDGKQYTFMHQDWFYKV